MEIEGGALFSTPLYVFHGKTIKAETYGYVELVILRLTTKRITL
jgi:hypothetical protein